MKPSLARLALGAFLLFSASAQAKSVVNAAIVEKLNAAVKECNGPGAEPKPKMGDYVTYLWEHGFKDAKVECGVSNYGPAAPVIMIHLADGGLIYVNYSAGKRGTKVKEMIEDAKEPEGMKRYVIWPAPKAPKEKKVSKE
ncbi:MAG: hypothetical protein JST04_07980 [Bdellovibrionales bacterium]|nr:hypothetical protein [Bdellovibrionales bacterium]